MENIYILLLFFLVFWYFVFIRKVAEKARYYAKQYCDKEDLQFITIARRSSRLSFNKRQGLNWLSVFEFEFSGDGVSQYQGVLSMRTYKLEGIDIPAYRIN
ncbi:DUF3301 domain-containing protein [Thalassotalea ganghwensis]